MEELRIKEILKQQGKTMQDLADMIGINRVNLSNSLNGNPTLERLRQVAEYLNVDLKNLFNETKKEDIEIFGLIKINEDVCIIDSFLTLEEVYNKAKLFKDNMAK